MRDGVGSQLGDHEGCGLGCLTPVRDAPRVELMQRETPGETGATASRAEALEKREVGVDERGSGLSIGFHVTQRGRPAVP
ncbi:hypothetical protein GCM10010346_32190 [Streptomyces chryseus]|uniref:Uncharacterized protein n=1 Tax=Streptomyces chryseus TaxID=68186 RepID=A0ABQ3DQB7_9ACTN|nr:hypothetical protein GCM10010346_32190 [Streptomyces chryseus]